MPIEGARETLAGLTAVNVQVAPLNADAERDGLVSSEVREAVESMLRTAGITPLTPTELFYAARGTPILLLDVGTVKLDGSYAYSVRLELYQAIRLERDPSVRALAVTWSAWGLMGTIGAAHLADLHDTVRAVVGEFIVDHRAANPPP